MECELSELGELSMLVSHFCTSVFFIGEYCFVIIPLLQISDFSQLSDFYGSVNVLNVLPYSMKMGLL